MAASADERLSKGLRKYPILYSNSYATSRESKKKKETSRLAGCGGQDSSSIQDVLSEEKCEI